METVSKTCIVCVSTAWEETVDEFKTKETLISPWWDNKVLLLLQNKATKVISSTFFSYFPLEHKQTTTSGYL